MLRKIFPNVFERVFTIILQGIYYYKPLNKVLQWIRYPIPNKRDLLNRLYDATIFSKFDMKSGFWQIQIKEEDRYKTAFKVWA